MIWTPEDETCTGDVAGTLTLCEWLSTMDGLLVGELTGISPVRTTRPGREQPPLEDTAPWDCPDQHLLAMDLQLEPIARFGQASTDDVNRVTVGPDDLRRWVPQPELAPGRWGHGALVWGGIPDDVPEREADTIHAGTGRLMPARWEVPGQILVLPVIAGEPDPEGGVRYGLGRHLFGLFASEAPGEAPSRVLFQRATECIEPYKLAEDFRDLPPYDFLQAVESCYAQGLPDPKEGPRFRHSPLDPDAFDSRCVTGAIR